MTEAIAHGAQSPASAAVGVSPALEIRGLNVVLNTSGGALCAVQDVSFSVKPGETLCLVGESGCGKSITSLAIMDLLPEVATRSAEAIRVEGVDLLALKSREMNRLRGVSVGMIFQEPMTALNPVLTIGEQLTEIYRCHRHASKRDATARAIQLLERVGIGSAAQRLKQFPHELSGGLRQRVMIAMALMCDPKVLIADEPTTALDVTIQAQILRLLQDLQRELGLAIVLVTHDLGIVSRIAQRVAVMYAGRIVEEGTVEQIFSRPSHPYTRGLMACIPVPGSTRPGDRLGVIRGTVPALSAGDAGCSFRDRCDHAFGVCETPPPLRSEGLDHRWRCHLQSVANVEAST